MNENKEKQMTTQEAIIIIQSIPQNIWDVMSKSEEEAIDMALGALEKQAGIERALERLEELAETYLGDANCAVYESIEIIKQNCFNTEQ